MANHVNESIKKEREACQIDPEPLTHFLDGSIECTLKRRKFEAIIANDEIFSNAENIFLTRQQRYRRGREKAKKFHEIATINNFSKEEKNLFYMLIDDMVPTYLHYLMFVPNINLLFSEEQKRFWLPKCETLEVIGCYAQTEMGHGSNIRALETTATYKPDIDQFEINSPTLTSTKWWPGTLGRTANHAVVIAQLIINERKYGIHNFIVPIRDPKTHLPLPNIEVGDIGPKIGFNAMDNGFCRFSKVLVPRKNMAERFSKVEKGGLYRKINNIDERVAYITMMQVRAYIVQNSGQCLAKAATIVTRYSIVRKQGYPSSLMPAATDKKRSDGGKKPPKSEENMILDYVLQRYRIFPMIASAYAFHFAGRVLSERLADLEKMIESEDNKFAVDEALAAFHSSTSGLKSLCSSIAAEGIEDLRKACGGHGYLASSGLPELLTNYLQNCTVEGENHMLTQQAVRFLLKTVNSSSESFPEEVIYLKNFDKCRRCSAVKKSDVKSWNFLAEAYQHRAAKLVHNLRERIAYYLESKEASEASNSASIEAFRASRGHSLLLVLRMFKFELDKAREILPFNSVQAIENLLLLFGLYFIERDMGDFTEDGYLSENQAEWVRKAVVETMEDIRKDCLALVDAWDFSDRFLGSVLGRKDGNVYKALMEMGSKSSLNEEEFVRGLGPLIQPSSKL